jgi:hypothetical protein
VRYPTSWHHDRKSSREVCLPAEANLIPLGAAISLHKLSIRIIHCAFVSHPSLHARSERPELISTGRGYSANIAHVHQLPLLSALATQIPKHPICLNQIPRRPKFYDLAMIQYKDSAGQSAATCVL